MNEEQIKSAWAQVKEAAVGEEPVPPAVLFDILADVHVCLAKLAGRT